MRNLKVLSLLLFFLSGFLYCSIYGPYRSNQNSQIPTSTAPIAQTTLINQNNLDQPHIPNNSHNCYTCPPSKTLICKSNSDCILDYDLCGFKMAINKSRKKEYKSWRKKILSEATFDCMNPHNDKSYKPQCVDSKCKAVLQNKKDK
ncbi:MAG: hypothetical protein OXJ52_07490 [Oligoflexia bacterium]|nr:hypothetical protein [Oligoflexia bacterium]